MKHAVITFIAMAAALSGCASTAVPYIYSPEERAYTTGGNSYQMGATGEVSYCDAGLAQLVASRRKEALAAIAETCHGEENYSIKGEGGGGAGGRYVGNFKITPSCTRGRTIIFKCHVPEPKYDRRK